MNIKTCTIFIPLFNEEDIIRKNVHRLLEFTSAHNLDSEIILGSNGSTDSTPEIIKQLSLKHDNIKNFHIPRKGTGKAFIEGIKIASNECIISLDIDLSTNINFILLAIQFLEYAVMIIGCKRMRLQQRPFVRKLGSNFFIFIASTLLGTGAADFSIGAKAYRRSFVLKHIEELDAGTAYVLELIYFAAKEEEQIIELPVDCNDNRQSHFNLVSETLYKFKHLFSFFLQQKTKN